MLVVTIKTVAPELKHNHFGAEDGHQRNSSIFSIIFCTTLQWTSQIKPNDYYLICIRLLVYSQQILQSLMLSTCANR